jgi:excisionase family DNA binding protein
MSAQATPEPTRPWLSPEQAAALAGVSLSTVRRAIDSGELRAGHVGGWSAFGPPTSTATSIAIERTVQDEQPSGYPQPRCGER